MGCCFLEHSPYLGCSSTGRSTRTITLSSEKRWLISRDGRIAAAAARLASAAGKTVWVCGPRYIARLLRCVAAQDAGKSPRRHEALNAEHKSERESPDCFEKVNCLCGPW